MLAQKNKIKREEMPQIIRFGRVFHGNFLTVRTSPILGSMAHTKDTSLHASVVIPKACVKKATDRNLWKRRIYSVIEKFKHKNMKIVIFAKKEIKTASFIEVKKDLENIISKLA